jgi:hypothetical protein
MGLIINGTKMGMPFINGVKHNAFINGQKIWRGDTESFKFLVADAGSFNIPVSGVNGGGSTYQSYNWEINWGDGNIETVSGGGHNTATIPHTYSDGVGSHTITIKPNGTATQGWFNAFGAGGTQIANLAKIKQLYSPITSRMRTMNDYAFCNMFQNCTGLTSIPANLLPATTLATSCYYSMFQGCTGLTSLPANLLPATTLANDCYHSMFSGCSKLTSIPYGFLPATTLVYRCYALMFNECSGLT